MPTPTRSDMHINAAMANFTVAALQSDDAFVCFKAAPVLPVEKESDYYFTYPTGAFNRLEMRRRGTSEDSAGGGWTLSNTTYSCVNYAVHKDFDDDDAANADAAIDPERDAVAWGENQIRMQADSIFATNCFGTSKWTSDVTGVSSSAVEGTSALHWNDASSDPQEDVEYWKGIIKGRIGRDPNCLVVGQTTHHKIIVNPQVRDSLKYTTFTSVREVAGKLAAYFGVDQYHVAGGFYNSAAENQTATLTQLLAAKGALLTYVDATVGKHVMTGARTFAWKRDGRGSNGIYVREFRMENLKSTRYEFELYVDVKLITADAGAYFNGIVA